MKLLISLLGNFRYKEVSYSYTLTKPSPENGSPYKDKSQISSHIIAKAENVDRWILLVPFTIYHEHIKDFNISGNSYDYYIKKLKEALHFNENISKQISYFIKNFENEEKGTIYIIPGFGTFKSNYKDSKNESAKGVIASYSWEKKNEKYKITMMRDYIYIKLYNELRSINVKEGEEVEIFLDITHGINYYSIITYDALLNAIYSRVFNKVILRVYNSDPVNTEPMDGEVFNLNNIITTIIQPKDCYNLLVKNFNLNSKENQDTQKMEIEYKKIHDDIFKLGSAAEAGQFILIHYLNKFNYLNEIFKPIDSVLQKFDCDLKVKLYADEKENLREFKYSYDNEYFRNLYMLHSFLNLLKSINLKEEKICGEVANNCLAEDTGIRITSLKDVAQKYGGKLIRDLIRNEIDQLEKTEKEYNKGWSGFIRLRDILDKCNQVKSSSYLPNERNMIAHGGLERNITCIFKYDDDILIRYSSSETCSEIDREGALEILKIFSKKGD